MVKNLKKWHHWTLFGNLIAIFLPPKLYFFCTFMNCESYSCQNSYELQKYINCDNLDQLLTFEDIFMHFTCF